MKNQFIFKLLILFCLTVFIGSCRSVRIRPTRTFISQWALMGVHTYLTLNFVNREFYYTVPMSQESYLGTWEENGDTLILNPYLTYYFNRNNEIRPTLFEQIDTTDLRVPLIMTKLLVRKDTLISISCYPDCGRFGNNRYGDFIAVDKYKYY